MSKTKLLDDFELVVMHGDPLTAAPRSAWEFEGDNAIVPQQPTGSAYSVEEHMFKQDEIQRRHQQASDEEAISNSFDEQAKANTTTRLAAMGERTVRPEFHIEEQQPTDQQRSEADIERLIRNWAGLCEAEKCDMKKLLAAEKLWLDAIAALQARVRELEQRESDREESLRLMKEHCVDKCGHPAEYVCYYEDGTRHCLECEAMKWWTVEACKEKGT